MAQNMASPIMEPLLARCAVYDQRSDQAEESDFWLTRTRAVK
jgi:hypothetical protein